jgi:transglutaminase-like putative cysteine protease
MPDASTQPTAAGMRLRLRHLTRFLYEGAVMESHNELRLRPIDDALQECLSYELRLNPKATVSSRTDFHRNVVEHFELHQAHESLEIEAVSTVQTYPESRPEPPPGLGLERLNDPSVDGDFFDFLAESKLAPVNRGIWREAVDILAAPVADLWRDALKLAAHIHRSFRYVPNSTAVHTDGASALQQKQGVCQDYAHALISLCRSQQIPARYVSGYFFNGNLGDQNEASHAWVEIFVPGQGWRGWDPTHDRAPDTRYVRLASGRDYQDVKPVAGHFLGRGTKRMEVEVQICEAKPL